MDYVRFAINNPVKVTVGVLLLVLFGLMALFMIPVQLVPDVDEPLITVETIWTGRSPEEIEREIIEPQEEKLKGVTNLRKMTAQASQGRALISLEFYVGSNLDRALQETSDKLREVPSYPVDVDQPVISSGEADSENAIAWMVLRSTDPDYDLQQVYDFADKRVKPYLERVEGLSSVNIYGGREREVHIQVDPHRLAQRGITFSQLRAALQGENLNISAGDLADGRLDVRVRVVGQYEDPETILQTVIAYTDGGPVRVRDVAEVEITLEKRRSFVRSSGQPALALAFVRETGANVMQVMEQLRTRVVYVNDQILPQYEGDQYGLSLEQVYDETVYIDDALALVQSNLVIGGALAVMVLLLFLRTVRPTLVVSLAIPISVIGTFVVMTAFGRNINVISLAGLAFAVGMVVDNAIVVLENIDRHINMGARPMQAAHRAAKEVWGAIVASTLTTAAVFIPVLTIEEEAGQLFRDIALAITAAVTLSLIVSVTVIPTASAHWLKPMRKQTGLRARFRDLFGLATASDRLARRYADLIHWMTAVSLRGVGLRLGVVVLAMIVSVVGAVVLMPPATYLPHGNMNLIFGIMFTPPAYNVQQSEFIAHRIESGLRPYWEADSVAQASALGPVQDWATGQSYTRVPAIDDYFFVSWGGTIFMGASSIDKQLVQPLAPVMSNAMSSIPGSFGFAQQASLFGSGIGGNTIDVELSADDLDDLRDSATAMLNALVGVFGYSGVRPDPLNFTLSGPELQVRPDYVRASELGINVADLGVAVSAMVDGAIIGDYRLGGDSVDLLLTRHPSVELKPDMLRDIPLAYVDRLGQRGTVPLAAVANLVPAQAPQQINRIEQIRAITLTVMPPVNMPLETAGQRISQITDQLTQSGQIAPGVEVVQAGTADKLVQVRTAMLGRWTGLNWESIIALLSSRIFLSLLITFLVMAALFESFLYPFVIMFSVPLATVGGFLGLAIVHWFVPSQQMDVLTMLGFIILIGIVVNNAILLVHQALNFMRGIGETESHQVEVLAPRDAIRESVRTRIRPIFMTTMTSVFGMLPLVVMPGSGAELYRGLGSVVLGGLMISTIFTLLVVPLVFSLVLDLKIALYRALDWPVREIGEGDSVDSAPSTEAPAVRAKPTVATAN